MIISKLNIYSYTAPFKSPIKTNLISLNQRKVLIAGAVIDGVEYFAEANSFETPWYHYETIDTVHKSLVSQFQTIKKKPFSSIEALNSVLDSGQPNASSCFDIIAYQYFKSLVPVTVPIGQTLHHDARDIELNAARVKLKMHNNILEQVQIIRKASDIQIVIDANGLMDLSHFDLINKLALYDILYFEEPFSSINDYRTMQRLNPDVSLAIDESATDARAIQRFYESGVHTAVIKYSRIGGVTRALKIKEDLPEMKLVSGGMYEFGLSKYFTAMLGETFQTVPDITPKGTYFAHDFAEYDECTTDNYVNISVPEVQKSYLTLLASYD
ncbi:hypothetical protein ETI06_11640 [Macrococcoides goetzii]|nr:enolase C-terminal domain-like protein [Macrococcus goetzii]TDM39606.1 hypothetical protein ETI10_09165 [Macrococcus goetzii]TDM41505.1 hypothetical protein ETI08_11910 [Macrococcus goetzii]TDM46883.1 hypothetical protein ETI06_11640 [Macrococcus goetzii]